MQLVAVDLVFGSHCISWRSIPLHSRRGQKVKANPLSAPFTASQAVLPNLTRGGPPSGLPDLRLEMVLCRRSPTDLSAQPLQESMATRASAASFCSSGLRPRRTSRALLGARGFCVLVRGGKRQRRSASAHIPSSASRRPAGKRPGRPPRNRRRQRPYRVGKARLRADMEASVLTFGRAVDRYLAKVAQPFKNAKNDYTRERGLRVICAPLNDRPVERITPLDIAAILRSVRPGTARNAIRAAGPLHLRHGRDGASRRPLPEPGLGRSPQGCRLRSASRPRPPSGRSTSS